MKYNETLQFLFTQVPMFQRIGADAYKPGLDTSYHLDELFEHPHQAYRTIHVAGTNGKGSTSHTIASILQKSGYKVGLYTSPHLIDFRERIRVNGEMISENDVVSFVERYQKCDSDIHPSFFELTMTMAFDYFRREKVDIAVIEVGLGGRLDSTNIISPILSIITNISFDHTQFLGDTLPKIASEKAGIIKRGIPVVIGEADGDVKEVFKNKASVESAPIIFAQENPQVLSSRHEDRCFSLETCDFGKLKYELSGDCQIHNANTILTAIPELRKCGLHIPTEAIVEGFAHVCEISGLMGRWMQISNSPKVICDTGHNIGGFKYITKQLKNAHYTRLHIVIGFVSDKDVSHILELMPHDATYYFAQASVPRAMRSSTLAELAKGKGLNGSHFNSVTEAYNEALKNCAATDMIYVGGSTFVVADFLSFVSK